jgi:hypothetical protein
VLAKIHYSRPLQKIYAVSRGGKVLWTEVSFSSSSVFKTSILKHSKSSKLIWCEFRLQCSYPIMAKRLKIMFQRKTHWNIPFISNLVSFT